MGKGSRFKFTLPSIKSSSSELSYEAVMNDDQMESDKQIGDGELITDSPGKEKKNTEKFSTPLKILYVDDDSNHLIAKLFLKDLPIELDLVDNVAIAEEKFKASHYDLVIMDMQMPVMDGYEASGSIRLFDNDNGKKATPIIALSSYSTKEVMQKSIDAGCNDRLSKPIIQNDLIDVISKYTKI